MKREIRKDNKNHINKLIEDGIRQNGNIKVLKSQKAKMVKIRNKKHVSVLSQREMSKNELKEIFLTSAQRKYQN